MNPQEKANELFNKYLSINLSQVNDLVDGIRISLSKKCALIAVQQILNSNPHSNPFNTEIHSTYPYWEKVKLEIEKL
jgi:hypothetical protein